MEQGNDSQYIKKIELELKDYSPIEMASVFSGMLLDPKYQKFTYRLEYAIRLCLSHCNGIKTPNKNIIKNINKSLEQSTITLQEDPVEDINISSLLLNGKRYKVLLGLWEGCIPQTQVFLNILDDLPRTVNSMSLYKNIEELMNISNAIIKKNNLDTTNLHDITFMDTLLDSDIKKFHEYQNKVILKTSEISSEHITSINFKDFEQLSDNNFENSQLELNPMYIEEEKIILLLPTAITVTVRRLILNYLISQFSRVEVSSLLRTQVTKQIQDINIFGEFRKAPILFSNKITRGNFEFSEVLIEFDKGYFYHFIFVMDTLLNIDKDWFAGYAIASDEEVKYIDKLIQNTTKKLIKEDNNIKGCSFIIPCGLGRAIGLASNFNTTNGWSLESISLNDLETLSNDYSCNPHIVWRIIESSNKLKNMNINLMNMNGFLNLYGYVKDNNYSLIINNDTENSQVFSMIMLPIDCNFKLRKQVAKDTDWREVIHPFLKSVLVRRGFSDNIFDTNYRYNLYAEKNKYDEVFRVVYVDSEYSIWLEQPIISQINFDLQFQVYESAISWFCKIIIILRKFKISIDKNLKIWRFSFEFPEDINTLKKDTTKEEVLQSSESEFIDGILNTEFNISLIKGFSFEQNYSEQAMILAFLNFVKDENKTLDVDTMLKEIIGNEDARHTHFFMAHNYRDYFRLDREEPIYIETIDAENIKLDLGWSGRSREEGNTIEGKNECKKYLNNLVQVIWDILQQKLLLLDREYLVKKLLMNLELCGHQTKRWKRTFKANLSLQENETDTYNVTTEKIGRLNAASLSSRLVIEMALSECSVNCGKEAGKLDIQELICLASMLHHMGGLSEAINYEATTSRITISSFGDILFDHSFNDMIIKNYGQSIQKKELQHSMDGYGKNLITHTNGENAKDVFDIGFQDAFVAEFDYALDDASAFISLIEEFGLKENKLVLSIEYDELIDYIAESDRPVFRKVLDSFIFYARKNWTDIPKPYKSTDWQPWRFRRRYSVTMKPIIQIDSFENLLLISPQLLRDMFVNLVRNCYEACLDENHFQSKQMRHWIGSTRHKDGIHYERNVADKLKELGLEVTQGIKLSQILNKKMDDYGDIDVLAWDKVNNIVYPIECKGLEFTKTHGEIAKQLYEFKGQENSKGKKDRLLKHVKRIEELENDVQGLARFTKLNTNLQIKGLIVFSNIVPMVFDKTRLYKEKIDFLSYDNLNCLV